MATGASKTIKDIPYNMLKLLGQKKFVVFLFSCSFWVSSAFGFQGKLVKVLDGDTVEVMRDGRAVRIRLAEIDTPEKGQPFGSKAKRFVLDIAAGEIVRVRPTDQDRYGRTIGEIILPDDRSLNRLLVKRGYAWWYRQYSNDQSLGELEQIARKNSRGLWADPDPIAPWQWRRGERASHIQNLGVGFECGMKRYCKEMSSCEEAIFHLQECGQSRLDRDGDGVPCETLCR